jgi:Uma2 family endonuclease
MASVPKVPLTPEEYLAIEREAETKSEYVNGEVFAMAGASTPHNRIATDVVSELNFQLKGRNCEVFGSDMRIKVSPRMYTYADAVVVCGEPVIADLDNLVNPTLIVEVLSPSTEGYDRGRKFAKYRNIESFREYLLIAQDRCHVDHYLLKDGQWLLSDVHSLTDVIHLPSVNATLALAEVYRRVKFEGD